MKLGFLASHRGSDVQAVIEACAGGGLAAAPRLVISNTADAEVLERARHHGIATEKLGPQTLRHFVGRVLNIHPALLPKFGGPGMDGLRGHEAVLAAGDHETSVTIHVVDDVYDHGRIVAQCRVPVVAGDTAESLAARVLAREHAFLVDTLARIVAGEMEPP